MTTTAPHAVQYAHKSITVTCPRSNAVAGRATYLTAINCPGRAAFSDLDQHGVLDPAIEHQGLADCADELNAACTLRQVAQYPTSGWKLELIEVLRRIRTVYVVRGDLDHVTTELLWDTFRHPDAHAVNCDLMREIDRVRRIDLPRGFGRMSENALAAQRFGRVAP